MARIIATLSQLRSSNRALACGRHEQHSISDDLYAYSRRYCGNRLFVALHKGCAARINVPRSELPDGPHRCLLSGRRFDVVNGSIAEL